GFDINDMPRDARAQLRWFDAVARWGEVARAIHPPLRAGFGAFVSARGVEVWTAADEGGLEGQAWLRERQDGTSGARGAAPTRRSDPVRLHAEMCTWHQRLWDVEEPSDTPLVPGPTPATSIDGVTAKPLLTPRELYREGRTMRHCIGSMAG